MLSVCVFKVRVVYNKCDLLVMQFNFLFYGILVSPESSAYVLMAHWCHGLLIQKHQSQTASNPFY